MTTENSTNLDRLLRGKGNTRRHWLIFYALLVVGVASTIYASYAAITAERFFGLSATYSDFIRPIILFITIADIINIPGYFLLRHKEVSLDPQNKNNKLIVQFVSKGQNIEVLLDSARLAHNSFSEEGYKNYRIRLLTEVDISTYLDDEERDRYELMVVPLNYKPEFGTLFKARNLEYARLNSEMTDNEWCVFLDEESILTRSAARGILNFINTEDPNTIGQGLITYTARSFLRSPLACCADIKRVGFNIGKYYVQLKYFRDVYFGFQGSFFVTSLNVLQKIGFDHGAKTSITEDIFFANFAAKKGVKFSWIEGVVREQSAESILDFLRQRQRWIVGTKHFILDSRIPIIKKLSLIMTSFLNRIWGVIPLIIFLPSQLIHINLEEINLFQSLFIAGYCTALNPYFLIGYLYVIRDWNQESLVKKLWGALVLLCVCPCAAMLEQVAMLYAFFSRNKNFYVLRKTIS